MICHFPGTQTDHSPAGETLTQFAGGGGGRQKTTNHRVNNKMSLLLLFSGDRAMSPAQSEDSGLAADRSTTYATISLPREHVQAMAILLLGEEIRFKSKKLKENKSTGCGIR